MKIETKDFEVFLEGNESGRFLANPYWLEHLLNLFYQDYFGEVWEEIMDTKINMENIIDRVAYEIVGKEFNKKHLIIPKLNGNGLKG